MISRRIGISVRVAVSVWAVSVGVVSVAVWGVSVGVSVSSVELWFRNAVLSVEN